jgi:cobalt-precorrin 5A hydrolase
MSRTAILVLSRAGLVMARKIRDARPEGTAIFGPSCVVGRCAAPKGTAAGLAFPTDEPGVFGWVGPLRKVFPAVWGEFDAVVGVMALGALVRLVGPLASDKRRDPAVVAVDDAGRFAVSVLGGHGAGANELTRFVAGVLGATPVITTASEARGVPAVDLVGRELGWAIERVGNLTRVAAAVVRGERVAVYQDAGEPGWWRRFGPWPAHFARVETLDAIADLDPAAALVISDRVVPEGAAPPDRTLVYRPPTLLAGVGCKRGTPRATLDAWADAVFAAHGLSPLSLAAVATVHLKLDEPGLVAFAAGRGVPLVSFPPAHLDGVPGVERPSERVRGKVGIAAVAEPAALRAAGADRLLVPKQVGPGVTLAVARRRVEENASADDADGRR